MMARSTNAPCKGRIQKRKTNHLQIITFGLQRTAGPYKSAKTGIDRSARGRLQRDDTEQNDTDQIRRAARSHHTYFKRTVTPPTAADTSAPTFGPLSCKITPLAFCN